MTPTTDATAASPLRRLTLAAAAAAGLLLASNGAFAQFEAERPQEDLVGLPDEPLAEQDAEGEEITPVYNVEAGVTFTSEYFFRGIVQSQDGLFNGGVIAQPFVELGIPIIADPEKGYGFNAFVGTFNSFHSENVGDSGAQHWYESDLYGGLAFTTGNLEVGAIYTFYESPNGTFDMVQEIGGYAAYGIEFGDDPDTDDEFTFDLDFAAGIYFETEGSASISGQDRFLRPQEGIYAELGIEPSFELEVDGLAEPVALAFPVTVGIGVDNYYFDDGQVVNAAGTRVVQEADDEFLGFVSVVAAAGFPLPVPAEYGEWSITPQVEGLFLTADSLSNATEDGDDALLIGSITVAFEF